MKYQLLALVAIHIITDNSVRGTGIDGTALSNKLTQIANDGIGVDYIQKEYDKLTYTRTLLNGTNLIQQLSSTLHAKFSGHLSALTNLKNVVEQQYGSFTSSGTTNECCYATGLEYNSKFKGQVDLNEYCNMISGTAGSGRKLASIAVYNQMKANFNSNPNLKWQYYGSEEGVLFNYPKIKQSSCTSYDPRYRPWYVETATPKAKDVILVIDKSGSMSSVHNGQSYMSIAKNAATSVISTLNPNDRIGVVAFSSSPSTPPGDSSTSTCYSSTLALATPQNVKYLNQYVSSINHGGGTYYSFAIEKAFTLLKNTPYSGQDQVIIFLTDGVPSDTEVLILAAIRDQNHALGNRVVIMPFGIGGSLQTSLILTNMGQQINNDPAYGPIKKADYKWVENLNNLRSEMSSFYSYFSDSEVVVDPIFSVPYLDGFGIGLVTSACLPVYSGILRGVVCVDIPVPELIEDVSYFKQVLQGETSYAYIIDGRGRTLTHPMLPRPRDKSDDPIFVFIPDLEVSDTPGIAEVLDSMKSGGSGSKLVYSSRSMSRGDVKKDGIIHRRNIEFEYNWAPVGYGNFSVCVVVSTLEKDVTLNNLASTNSPQIFTYHRLDLKNSGTLCRHFQRFARQDTSTVMLTASAFEDPYSYYERNETLNDVNAYELYFWGITDTQYNRVQSDVRSSVVATSKVNSFWTSSNNTYDQVLVWRYIGTTAGIMRVYPGVQLANDYDHRTRSWWKRALANKGYNTFSAPYLDAWGAGYVITMAHSIYEGRSSNSHSTSDQIVAVLSVDFTISFLYGMIQEMFPDCQSSSYSCMVIDSSGYMVIHDHFLAATSSPVIESIHLIAKESAIAQDMISKGLLTRSACVDFEDIKNRLYWVLDVPSFQYPQGIVDNLLGTPGYIIHSVANSNIFLLMKVPNSTPSNCFCINDGNSEVSCSQTSMSACECPCHTPARYRYCNNTFDTTSDNWPTCTPVIPDLSSVKLEAASGSSLNTCFNYTCSNKTDKYTCYTAAGCAWCTYDANSNPIASAYCTEQELCKYGQIPGSTTGISSRDQTTVDGGEPTEAGGLSVGAIVGIVFGCVFVGGMGFAAWLKLKPPSNITSPNSTNQATQHQAQPRNMQQTYQQPTYHQQQSSVSAPQGQPAQYNYSQAYPPNNPQWDGPQQNYGYNPATEPPPYEEIHGHGVYSGQPSAPPQY